MVAAALEQQVVELAARYGQPRRVGVELAGAPFSPIGEGNRIGEVCMVIRRTNGRLITAIKTFYPPGAFRLLTGGINHGEAIEAALLRETWEETGLDVEVARFLAVIEYRLAERATPNQPADFVTFAFLLEERGGTLASNDPDERVGEFREIDVDDLPAVAERLAHVDDGYSDEIAGRWRDWGQFRAVVHNVVHAALRGV